MALADHTLTPSRGRRWFVPHLAFTHFSCCTVFAHSSTTPPPTKSPNPDPGHEQRRGGWAAVPYVLFNELAERLAAAGLSLNLISYLMGEYHMTQVTAASIISIVSGTASLTPLVGAFISDAYLGVFRTIVLGSVAHLISSLLLLTTAACRSLRPDAAGHGGPSQGQLAVLLGALAWTTVASGGLRPCTYAFGADQLKYQENPEDNKKQMQSFFNWYFFFLFWASLAGATVLVYVQDHAGWVWGFGTPTICVVVAISLLLLGLPKFRFVKPSGSPFTGFARVLMAAFHKRNLPLPTEARFLYQEGKIDHSDLPHTKRLKWLDHAAIVTDFDKVLAGSAQTNSFKLCTVNEVERLKAVVALLPIWTINILSSAVLSQNSSFAVPQARRTNRHLGSSGFSIPPASMAVFASITLILWMPFYDRVLVPRVRKITGKPGGITTLQRIGVGFFLSIVALMVGGVVEGRRRKLARRGVKMVVWWLVPQYSLFGLGEAFHSVGQLQFLYDQVPYNMRSVAGAVFWCSSGLGHYMGTVILQLVHNFSSRSDGGVDWLVNDMNRGHLDYYFYLLAILQTANLFMFITVSRRYSYKEEIVEEPAVTIELLATNPAVETA